VRLVGILGLVGLLVVPVALSGHHHADSAGANGCAACLVVHHAPAAAPTVVAVDALVLPSLPIAADPLVAPTLRRHSTQLGRGPPRTA
jgi:hypothetical protein